MQHFPSTKSIPFNIYDLQPYPMTGWIMQLTAVNYWETVMLLGNCYVPKSFQSKIEGCSFRHLRFMTSGVRKLAVMWLKYEGWLSWEFWFCTTKKKYKEHSSGRRKAHREWVLPLVTSEIFFGAAAGLFFEVPYFEFGDPKKEGAHLLPFTMAFSAVCPWL